MPCRRLGLVNSLVHCLQDGGPAFLLVQVRAEQAWQDWQVSGLASSRDVPYCHA